MLAVAARTSAQRIRASGGEALWVAAAILAGVLPVLALVLGSRVIRPTGREALTLNLLLRLIADARIVPEDMKGRYPR